MRMSSIALKPLRRSVNVLPHFRANVRRIPLCVSSPRLLYTQSSSTCFPPWSFSTSVPTFQSYRHFATADDEFFIGIVPNMGDSISEGTVSKIHKSVGDQVKVDEAILSLETDKVTVDINTAFSGTLTELLVKTDDVVHVGAKVFKVNKSAVSSTPSSPTPSPKKPETPKPEAPKVATSSTPSPPSPSPSPSPSPAAKPTPPPPTSQPSQPIAAGSGDRRVKMGPMRRRIAERLKSAQDTAALLTTFQECDMSAVSELRNTYQDVFLKKHGVKLGFMSSFVKASVAALQDQPSVNAGIDGDEIVYHDYCNISVAVATPRGLVVPVLRNCEKKSFADIEKELAALGNKARADQIAIEDMVGGTFTISNGGVYGSLMGTPIVNPPQSAILGMHGITKRAVVVNDKIEIRPMMYLALTYDHRLIDGREAVTFLRKIKDLVEDPRRLLLDL